MFSYFVDTANMKQHDVELEIDHMNKINTDKSFLTEGRRQNCIILEVNFWA